MDRDDVGTDAILRLLSQGGPEVQCAASIVLGALQPADPRVVPALACALHDAENPVKPYLLETLVSLSGPDVYRHVEPILRVEGPLRGQAADALTRHGARFLDDLKASCSRAAAGERDTYIRIIARIPDLGAIDWALESLPGLAMEDARTLVRSIRFALPGMPATLKRRLATGLVSFLRATPPGAAQVAETAVMKLLAVCGDGRAVTPLLQRVDQTEDPELGRHALHALASTPIPRNRHGTILRKLMPRLEEGEAPHLAEHGMRVITSLRPFPLDAPSVMSLTRSPNPRIAHMAVRSLRHFSGSDVVDRLLGLLESSPPELQAAAAATLGEVHDATDALLQAYQEPRHEPRRDTLLTIIRARPSNLDTAPFSRLMKRWLDPDHPPDTLPDRVVALAAADQQGLNRAVEARVRRAPGAAGIEILEPLVRNRLATPNGRYLLALCHLLEAGLALRKGDDHHDRAMQLLSPLARMAEVRLGKRLSAERRLPDPCLRAIVDHMAARSADEQAVAAAISGRLGRVQRTR